MSTWVNKLLPKIVVSDCRPMRHYAWVPTWLNAGAAMGQFVWLTPYWSRRTWTPVGGFITSLERRPIYGLFHRQIVYDNHCSF